MCSSTKKAKNEPAVNVLLVHHVSLSKILVHAPLQNSGFAPGVWVMVVIVMEGCVCLG